MLFPQTQLLLVDDSPLNLNILLEFLREKEYSCTTAQSGVQAWTMLEREPDRFHAVLLDRIMPEMDGMEVLHRMKHHTVLSQIPVIMQTAASTHQQTLEGLQAGAYYYLAKPFDKATLQAIVDAAVRDHISYLEKLGWPVTLKPYPEVGHAIPPKMRRELYLQLERALEATP